MLLEPIKLVCPHCGKISLHYDIMSYMVTRTEEYSDGKVIQFDQNGFPVDPPSFYKCGNCENLYEHLNSISKTDPPTDKRPKELTIAEKNPGIDDLIAGLNQKWSHKIEISLRLNLWWAINDLIRHPQPHPNGFIRFIYKLNHQLKNSNNWKAFKKYQKVFKENLHTLIGLIHQEPEFILLQAEMYRELAEYGKAKETISKVTSAYQKQSRAILPLIQKKRWQVAQI